MQVSSECDDQNIKCEVNCSNSSFGLPFGDSITGIAEFEQVYGKIIVAHVTSK